MLDRDEVGPGDVVEVSVDVTNIGQRAASEVVQCYVGDPGIGRAAPAARVEGVREGRTSNPGSDARSASSLDERALAFWDESSHGWLVEPGTFDVAVGASSRDLRGHATLTRKG